MAKYEELVEKLRYLAKVYSICENENTNEYRLAVESANAIEELNGKMKLYAFIWSHLPKDVLDTLLQMYREQEEGGHDDA